MPRIIDASPDPKQMWDYFQSINQPKPTFNFGEAISGGIGAYSQMQEDLERREQQDILNKIRTQKLEEQAAADQVKGEIANILAKYGGSGGIQAALPEVQRALMATGDLDGALKVARQAQALQLGNARLNRYASGTGAKQSATDRFMSAMGGAPAEAQDGPGLIDRIKGWFGPAQEASAEAAAPSGPGIMDRIAALIPDKEMTARAFEKAKSLMPDREITARAFQNLKSLASGDKETRESLYNALPTQDTALDVVENALLGGAVDASNAIGGGAQLLGGAIQNNLPAWMPGRETIGGGLESWGKEQRALGANVEGALPELSGTAGFVSDVGRMLAPAVTGPFAPLTWGLEAAGSGAGRLLDKGASNGEAALGGGTEGLLMTVLSNPVLKSWALGPGRKLIASALAGAKMGAGMQAATPLIEGALTGQEGPSLEDIKAYLGAIGEGGLHGAAMGLGGHIATGTLGKLLPQSRPRDMRSQMEDILQGRPIKDAEVVVEALPPSSLPGMTERLMLPAPEAMLGMRDPVQKLISQASEKGANIDKLLKAELPALPAPAAKKKGPESAPVEVPKEAAKEITLKESAEFPAPVAEIKAKTEPAINMAPEPTAEALRAEIGAPPEGVAIAIDTAPVARVNVAKIAIRPDTMQFKESDNAAGTNARDTITAEKWNDVAAGNVLLWEPLDPAQHGLTKGQKYIVANGHHRIEFAKKADVKQLNVQVLREADGFTANQARTIAAEANILEGKGSIYDQAKFLRNEAEARGKNEALARGRQIGIAGRKAQNIAIASEANLWTAFINEKISPEQAERIAKAAPNNDAAQRLGLDLVYKNPSIDPQELTIILNQAQVERGATIEGQQGSLFGADDSAMVRMQSLAKVAAQKIAETQSEIAAASGAAKRPELAAKSGINVANQETSLQRISALKERVAKLQKFWAYPEIKAEVEGSSTSKVEQLSLNQAKKQTKASSDEAGYFTLANDLAEGVRAVADATLREGLPSEAELAAMAGPGKATVKGVPDSERDLGGNIKLNPFSQGGHNLRIPGTKVRKMIGDFRKAIRFQETIAKKHPAYRPAKTAGENAFRYEHQVLYDAMADLSHFAALKDKTRVNEVFQALQEFQATGRKFPASEEAYRGMGLTEHETSALMGWHKFQKKAPDWIEEGLIADPPQWAKMSPNHMATYTEQVKAFTNEMREADYFPLYRWGDFYVQSADANGGAGHYSLHESAAEAKKELARLVKDGATAQIGKTQKPEGIVYEHMGPDLYHALTSFGEGGSDIPRTGFSGRLLKRKFTPGWSRDIERSVKSYMVSLARWRGVKLANAEFDKAIAAMEGQPALQAQALRYKERINRGGNEWAGVRRFLSLWYLTRPVSAVLNSFQPVITTLPEMVNQAGIMQGGSKWLNAAAKRVEKKFRNEKAFAKKYPELSRAIQTAERDGVFDSKNTEAIGGKYHEKFNGGSFYDKFLYLFKAAEYNNRLHAFIAGFELSRSKGLSHEEAIAFGRQISNKTQFDYSMADRPAITTGWKTLPATFQLFSGNYIRSLRDKFGGPETTPWGAKTKPLRALSLQLGVVGAIGGAVAIPGLSQLIKALEAAGYDPKGSAREFLQGYANNDEISTLFYGPAQLLGFNLSSNIALSELAPGAEQGVIPAVGRLVLGVAADIPQRAGRAKMLYGKGRYLEAMKQLMPPLARNVTDSVQWASTDPQGRRAIKSPTSGEVLVKNPTTSEIAMRTLGVTPARLNLAYEAKHTYDVIKEQAIDNKSINEKLAFAQYNKDPAEAKRLIQWVEEHNAKINDPARAIEINWPAVEQKFKALMLPGYGTWKRMPTKARPKLEEKMRQFEKMM